MGVSIEGAESPAELDDGAVKPELIDEIARRIVNRKLVVPAIFLLEAYKPLSGPFHHVLLPARPLLAVIFGFERADLSVKLVRSAESIEHLIKSIEEQDKHGRGN